MRRRALTLSVTALACWLSGSPGAAAVVPAEGAVLVLAFGQSIEARFPCLPQEGGLTVEESADFLDGWLPTPSPPVEVGPGECTVTLYQFPSGSAAVDAAPHVYYWRTRQCFARGTCDDIEARRGPIWVFTLERLPPPPPLSVTTEPAPAPPVTPTTVTESPTAEVTPAPPRACVVALRTLENVRGRLRAAEKKRDRRLIKERRKGVRRARLHARTVCR
jgi:hypothetical protein